MAVMFPLFVYGTFLPEEADHEIIAAGKHIGPAETTKGYTLVEIGALGSMIKSGEGTVKGELFEVPYEILAACDRKRDHPNLYHRVEIDLADGGAVQLDSAKRVELDPELRRRVDDLLGPGHFRLIASAPQPKAPQRKNGRERSRA